MNVSRETIDEHIKEEAYASSFFLSGNVSRETLLIQLLIIVSTWFKSVTDH